MKTFLRNLAARFRAFGAGSNAWLSGVSDAGRGGAELSNVYEQGEIVYACTQALVDNIAFLPFCITGGSEMAMRSRRPGRRSMGEDEIESGPVVDLFNQPHPQLSRFDFWEMLIAWLHIRGAAFVVATDDAGNVIRIRNRMRGDALPNRLVLLQSDRIVRILSGNDLIGWHYFSTPGSPKVQTNLLPEEVLHIRLPNLGNYIDPLAPAMVGQLAAQGDFAAGAFMKGLFANNADTGLIVSSDQWLTDEQRNQIASALRERKRQAGTADRPLLLGGGLRVEKPTVSSVDLQYLASRQFNRQQICAIFRVPEFILGFTADANRSIGVEQRAAFIQGRIVPLAQRLAAAVRPIVQMFDPLADCRFDVDCHPAMVEARRMRFSTARQALEMGVPLNDLNEVFDLGLDEYPWGDTAYVPFGLQPVGTEPVGDGEPTATDGPSAQPGGETQAGPHTESASSPGNPFTALALTLNQTRHTCAAHDAWLASTAASLRKKKTVCRSFFFAQRTRVLKRLGDMMGKATAPEVARAFPDLWNEDEENAALTAALKPTLLKDLQFGGAQVWQELGVAGDFSVPPSEALVFLGKRASSIKGINDTTWEALRGSLSEGLAKGDTYQQMVERVKGVYTTASQGRAETIAMTETNVAVNAGRFDGMVKAGVDKKAWLASNLANSRPSHQQAGRDYSNGIPIDEAFRVDGEYLDHPGDPNGSPGNTINCRCTVLAILGDKAVMPTRFLAFQDWHAKASKRPQDAPEASGGSSGVPEENVELQKVSGVLQSIPAQPLS